MKVGWKSCAIAYIAVEDIKHKSYPNSSKTMINIKHSSVFFSSFVSVVRWLASLLFKRLNGLDY